MSLLYLAVQVRQNTAAIQTSTSQDVYQQHQEQTLMKLESADVAEVLLRAERSPDEMSPVDSLRYDGYLNLRLNLWEAVYTNALQGTMEADMAAGWLNDLPTLTCIPGMKGYWARWKDGYHPAFRAAVDSAASGAPCA